MHTQRVITREKNGEVRQSCLGWLVMKPGGSALVSHGSRQERVLEGGGARVVVAGGGRGGAKCRELQWQWQWQWLTGWVLKIGYDGVSCGRREHHEMLHVLENQSEEILSSEG